jgi:hypothetical protein
MSYVLFISEARLKKLTAVHANVEPDELTPFVVQAQDIYIQEILGTYFYNSLKNKVTGDTVTGYYQTLLDDYIAPTLANYAVYLAFPSLNYKIKNKAVMNPTSEESNATDLTSLKYVRGSIQDTAQFYAERTREYLRDNQEQFPEYLNPGVDGMMPNKNNPYFHGVYIPKYYGCGDNLPDNPNPMN